MLGWPKTRVGSHSAVCQACTCGQFRETRPGRLILHRRTHDMQLSPICCSRSRRAWDSPTQAPADPVARAGLVAHLRDVEAVLVTRSAPQWYNPLQSTEPPHVNVEQSVMFSSNMTTSRLPGGHFLNHFGL